MGASCRGANVLVGHRRLQAARGCSQLCRPLAPVPGRSSRVLSLQSCSLCPPGSRAARFLLRQRPQPEDEALPRAPYSRAELERRFPEPPHPLPSALCTKCHPGVSPAAPAAGSQCLAEGAGLCGSGFVLLLPITMKTPRES